MSIEVKPGPVLAERTTLGLGGLCLAEVAVTAETGLEGGVVVQIDDMVSVEVAAGNRGKGMLLG